MIRLRWSVAGHVEIDRAIERFSWAVDDWSPVWLEMKDSLPGTAIE